MSTHSSTGIEAERVNRIICAQCQKTLDVSHLPSFSEIKCPECGLPQIVPAKFGGFWLIGRLGSGGMGVIYHAMDKELGRHVALKVMKKELGDNEEFVQSFKHEAQAAASLNHPNVVQIYSFGQAQGQTYIAMELVIGGRLDEMIADGNPVEEVRALEIHLQVVSGLKAASAVGLVHGDIKPANILFGQNGEAKVVDFGLASFVGQQQQGGPVWGTPYYIAPEKARGKPVDFRSDIYSLGATLFHVLIGQPPFDGATSTDVVMARLNNPAPAITDFNQELHPETAAMIARMLEIDPANRYPSYPALLIDMEAALEAARKPFKHPPIVRKKAKPLPKTKANIPRKPRFTKKQLQTAGLIGAGILLIAGLAYGLVAYQRHKEQRALQAAEWQKFTAGMEAAEKTWTRIQALSSAIIEAGAPLKPLAERIEAMAAATTSLNELCAQADLEATQGLEILNETEDLRSLSFDARARAMAATNLAALTAPQKELDDYFNSLIANHNILPQTREAAAKLFKDAQTTQNKLLAADRQARDQAAQAAAKQRAAEAARRKAQQEAAAYQKIRPQLIQQELDQTDQARGENEKLICKFDLESAIQSLNTIKDNFKTPEGAAYHKNVLDAYQAMLDLKTFVIKAITQTPYKGGWPSPSGPARDIAGADPAQGLTISIGAAGSTIMAWEKVPLPQLLKIADHYINAAAIDNQRRAQLWLAMSLLCYENTNWKLTEVCIANTCKIQPDMQTEINRLMPDFAP